jgi:TPR repeat protein
MSLLSRFTNFGAGKNWTEFYSLIPPSLISKFNKEGNLTSSRDAIYSLVNEIVKNSNLNDHELLQKLKAPEFGTHQDWEQIAKILTVHSRKGIPIGARLYKLAGLNGSLRAEFKYAELLSKGYDGQKRIPKEAFSLIKKLADKMHPQSNYIMAMDSIKRKSFGEAVHYLKIASELGYGPAKSLLGSFHAKGRHVKQDLKKGFELLTEAHKLNVPDAAANLSEYYITGVGLDSGIDRQKAFDLLQESATAGVAIAQHNIASMYFDNDPIPKQNITFAIEYFKMAAEQKYVPSCFTLATLCEKGLQVCKENVPKDLLLAREFYQRVLKYGNSKDHGEYIRNSEAALEKLNGLMIQIPKNRII